MIIEYNIECFQRILRIKFPDSYENLKDKILQLLEKFYFEWHGNDLTEEEFMAIHDTCCEEYMIEKLSDIYNVWEEWDSIYYGE